MLGNVSFSLEDREDHETSAMLSGAIAVRAPVSLRCPGPAGELRFLGHHDPLTQFICQPLHLAAIAGALPVDGRAHH